MANGFRVDVESAADRALITVLGELDLATCAQLEAELEQVAECPLVVVDLSKLDFIDSTGLGTLVRAYNRFHADGRRFILVQGGGQVRRLLELTGLSSHLELLLETPDIATL